MSETFCLPPYEGRVVNCGDGASRCEELKARRVKYFVRASPPRPPSFPVAVPSSSIQKGFRPSPGPAGCSSRSQSVYWYYFKLVSFVFIGTTKGVKKSLKPYFSSPTLEPTLLLALVRTGSWYYHPDQVQAAWRAAARHWWQFAKVAKSRGFTSLHGGTSYGQIVILAY